MKKLLRINHRFISAMERQLFIVGCTFLVVIGAIIKNQRINMDLSHISSWVADVLMIIAAVLIISYLIDAVWMMFITVKPLKFKKSSLAKRIESAEKNVEVK